MSVTDDVCSVTDSSNTWKVIAGVVTTAVLLVGVGAFTVKRRRIMQAGKGEASWAVQAGVVNSLDFCPGIG